MQLNQSRKCAIIFRCNQLAVGDLETTEVSGCQGVTSHEAKRTATSQLQIPIVGQSGHPVEKPSKNFRHRRCDKPHWMSLGTSVQGRSAAQRSSPIAGSSGVYPQSERETATAGHKWVSRRSGTVTLAQAYHRLTRVNDQKFTMPTAYTPQGKLVTLLAHSRFPGCIFNSKLTTSLLGCVGGTMTGVICVLWFAVLTRPCMPGTEVTTPKPRWMMCHSAEPEVEPCASRGACTVLWGEANREGSLYPTSVLTVLPSPNSGHRMERPAFSTLKTDSLLSFPLGNSASC